MNLVQDRLRTDLLFSAIYGSIDHHAFAGRIVAFNQAVQRLRQAFHASFGQETHATGVHAENRDVMPKSDMRRRKHGAVATDGKQQVHLAKRRFLDNLDRLFGKFLQVIENAESHLRMGRPPLRNLFKGKSKVCTLVFPTHDTDFGKAALRNLLFYRTHASSCFAFAISISWFIFCKTPG